MAFKVDIAESAEWDIDEAASYIATSSSAAATKWLTELWSIIFALNEMPARYALIPEADEIGFPYRSALYHSQRIIFRIYEARSVVFVLRVYHAARKPLTKSDFRP